MTVVAQAVNDLPTIKRPAGANVATTGCLGDWAGGLGTFEAISERLSILHNGDGCEIHHFVY